jgi:hypothetical protein
MRHFLQGSNLYMHMRISYGFESETLTSNKNSK